MNKRDILLLLRELLRDASIMQSDPDDASGCNTRYYVDQEQLMRNIEAALEHPESLYVICYKNKPEYKGVDMYYIGDDTDRFASADEKLAEHMTFEKAKQVADTFTVYNTAHASACIVLVEAIP